MKKYILVASLAVICAVGSLLVYARPQQDNERRLACRRGCNESFAACLSNTPATDPKKEEERKSVCRQRQADCLKYCD